MTGQDWPECDWPGCGEDATCDAYDVHWAYLAPYCLDHGKAAFLREGERVRALGLEDASVGEIRAKTPRGQGGAHFLRSRRPGDPRRRPGEDGKDRTFDDDPTIDDREAEEDRQGGASVVRLT